VAGPGLRATTGALSISRHGLILGLLLVVAAGVRLYGIADPPLSFHATRQYRSLLIARGHYYAGLTGLPDWKRHVAEVNMDRQGVLEPPVGEYLTSIGYRVFGESYWLPRTLSVVFWLVGAILLWRIGARLLDRRAGLLAAAVYLFLPFGVVASRSFQPDPLMLMLVLAGVLSMLRFRDDPSGRRLFGTAALSAMAVFVKPAAIFLLLAVFVAQSIHRHGKERFLVDRSLWAYVAVALLPVVGYYLVYGIVLSGDLETQTHLVLPAFVLDPSFWRGWLGNVRAVVGLPLLIGSLLGAVVFPRGMPRATIVGLWAGYASLCLVLSWGSANHDYYHLPLIPIAALSLAPLLLAVLDRLREAVDGPVERYAIAAILVVGSILSILTVRPRLIEAGAAETVRTAERIGSLVGHGTRNVVLASDYGLSLQYHGELSSQPWPLASDLEWERVVGEPALEAETRFQEWFGGEDPEFFIVIDRSELVRQDDLERFLSSSFPVLARTDDFLIFDLRRPLG